MAEAKQHRTYPGVGDGLTGEAVYPEPVLIDLSVGGLVVVGYPLDFCDRGLRRESACLQGVVDTFSRKGFDDAGSIAYEEDILLGWGDRAAGERG